MGGATSTVTCNTLTLPTASGSLTVTSGYVTQGTLKGYGFSWMSDKPSSGTCVIPACGTSGCLPAFGNSALCAAGIVAPDSTYNTNAAVGMNLNQSIAGGTPGTIAAPASITVSATKGSDLGDGGSGNGCVWLG